MDHQEESEAYAALGANGSSIQRAFKRGINEADRLASSQRGPNAGDSTPSTVQEVVQCKQARNSIITGDGAITSEAPNFEPGTNFISWSGIERGRHVEAHSTPISESVAPATGLATIHRHTEEAATTGGYTTSDMAQISSGPPSNYKGWLRQQLNQLDSGFLPPWATPNSSATNKLKPSLADSEELLTFEAQIKFLNHLLDIIDGQQLPVGEWVVENVHKAMESVKKWQKKAQNLKVSRFALGIEACLDIFTNFEHVEKGPRFRNLLVLLDQTVSLMKTPSLAPLLEKIQELHNNTPEDQKVDPRKLQNGIYVLIEILY